MTTDRATRLAYAGAIGGLCAANYDIVPGLVTGLLVILLCNVIGALFGEDF